MRDSLILSALSKVYGKLGGYYKYSVFYRLAEKSGKCIGTLAASSSILGFFDREWKIGSAWKRSYVFSVLIIPLKLLKYASNKLSYGTNIILEGSGALSSIKNFLSRLFKISCRVYGLFMLTFAVTVGLLNFISGQTELTGSMEGIISLVLFLAGACLILINRPLDELISGSIVGNIAYDFFTLKDGSEDDK